MAAIIRNTNPYAAIHQEHEDRRDHELSLLIAAQARDMKRDLLPGEPMYKSSVRAVPSGLMDDVIDPRSLNGAAGCVEDLTFADLETLMTAQSTLAPVSLPEALAAGDAMGIEFDLHVWLFARRAHRLHLPLADALTAADLAGATVHLDEWLETQRTSE